jgi:hypothetical protein
LARIFGANAKLWHALVQYQSGENEIPVVLIAKAVRIREQLNDVKSIHLSENNGHHFRRADLVMCAIISFISLETPHRFGGI